MLGLAFVGDAQFRPLAGTEHRGFVYETLTGTDLKDETNPPVTCALSSAPPLRELVLADVAEAGFVKIPV
jgi:hypothetical protein